MVLIVCVPHRRRISCVPDATSSNHVAIIIPEQQIITQRSHLNNRIVHCLCGVTITIKMYLTLLQAVALFTNNNELTKFNFDNGGTDYLI